MKPKNKKAFKALIKKYESIRLEDIPELTPLNERKVKTDLTGFGFTSTCTLCKSVDKNCGDCVFYADGVFFPCSHSKAHSKTYEAIEDAKTPEELIQAYRARAEHMKRVLSKLTPGKGNGLHLGVVIIDEAKSNDKDKRIHKPLSTFRPTLIS